MIQLESFTIDQVLSHFEDYLKPPFRLDGSEIYVYSSENKLRDTPKAFDFFVPGTSPVGRLSSDDKKWLMDKLNGDTEIIKDGLFSWESNEPYIYYQNRKMTQRLPVMRVRSWGMLTGIGGFNLDPDTALDIQSSLLEYTVRMLNKN